MRTFKDIIKYNITIKNIDGKKIPKNKGELRLFATFRNEAMRIPYFFDHYRQMGIDRFFIIDNGSTDSTRKLLLMQPNTHVFSNNETYGVDNNYGIDWLNHMLYKYGIDHWCLSVDADEQFIYPNYEEIPLKSFCKYLDKKGYECVGAMLLDMYSDKPIKDNKHYSVENPFENNNYFDPDTHFQYNIEEFLKKNNNKEILKLFSYYGGMRIRVFGLPIALDKHCLFKFKKGFYLGHGQHDIISTNIAPIKAAVLHFKYTSDFIKYASIESRRNAHWNNAVEYKRYNEVICNNPNLNLYYENSKKFINSQQLVDYNIMRSTEDFNKYCLGS